MPEQASTQPLDSAAMFGQTATAFARLTLAADHMLSGPLGRVSDAVYDLKITRNDPMGQVFLHTVVRRSFYGSVLRATGDSVALLSQRSSLSRVVVLAARAALESAAEMNWLYYPPDEDDRFERALDLMIAEEQDREELVARGGLVSGTEVPPEAYFFRNLAESEGYSIRVVKRPRRGGATSVGGGLPGKGRLIDDLQDPERPAGFGRHLYSTLSTISHGAQFLTLEEPIQGDSVETLSVDHFGSIDLDTARLLLVATGSRITRAVLVAAEYLGQDGAEVAAGMRALAPHAAWEADE